MSRTPFAHNIFIRGRLPEQPCSFTLPPSASSPRRILTLLPLALGTSAARVTGVIRRWLHTDHYLLDIREADFIRASSGSGRGGLVSFPAAAVVKVFSATPTIGGCSLPGLEEDTPMLRAVGRRWGERAVHWCQTPFLHVRFDEDEAELAKVHVHGARAVCAECGEEVEGFEAVRYVVEFFAVAREEDGAAAGTVPNTYHVTLDVGGPVRRARERLVVAAVAGRGVGEGVFMPSCRHTYQQNGSSQTPLISVASIPGNRNIG